MKTIATLRRGCTSSGRVTRRSARAGFTLLEVILALGLAVVVIGLIGNSVQSTLKFIDRGRERTERDQLARAILSKIATDIRGTVRTEPFDPTGMISVKSTSKSGGKSGGKGGTGGTTGGTGGSTAASGSTGSTDSASSASSTTDDTAALTTPTIAGVYGSQYSLQVDVGRLPNVYEYAAQSSGTASAPISDVRSVSYYMADGSGSIGGTMGATTASGTGLVRSELDRAAAVFSTAQGGTPESEGAAAIVAPEIIAIDFQYFDGASWVYSWDSTASSGLPQSVKIRIAMSNPAMGVDATTAASVDDAAAQDPDSVYSVVVLLPARNPVTPVAGAASSTASDSASSSTSSSSGTPPTGGGK